MTQRFCDQNGYCKHWPATLRTTLSPGVDEYEAALKLLYQRYYAFGLTEPQHDHRYKTPWLTHKESYQIVVHRHQRLMATLTCVLDSSIGLPMQEAMEPELTALRGPNVRLCELSGFGTAHGAGSSQLFQLYAYAVRLGYCYLDVTDFVAAVHPRHVGYYQRQLGFTPMTEVRAHPRVKDAPAVMMHAPMDNFIAPPVGSSCTLLYHIRCTRHAPLLDARIGTDLARYQRWRREQGAPNTDNGRLAPPDFGAPVWA